ncbi:MAG: DinB family protein [Saprospiraceae bacterium]|nr:DinB family protein [Saprospiraceae bacterium]MCF8251205.1 DinB family protein [Saprospiraceae bacterium]MCF8282362.1 DinB family protein [Bacteroidales bacterium]MCF8313017.1 DinB family protein [Saprospiraceae bacterium]MCF8441464.1 DinB family protein [Saprospiraceae bacterium]
MGTIPTWITELGRLTKAFTTEFGCLTSEELNRKPNASTWSIGQVIDHIITVNESYYPIVEQLRAGTYRAPWTAKLPFLVNWFGDFILNGVEPERRKKVKTFQLWEPAQSEVRADVVAYFAEHQRGLAGFIAMNADLVEAGTGISSPANRFITYKIGRAFDIIVAHERRHLNQSREILNFLKKN